MLCWESLSRQKPFEGIYLCCSCPTLCCPNLSHKFPYCREIMIQTALSFQMSLCLLLLLQHKSHGMWKLESLKKPSVFPKKLIFLKGKGIASYPTCIISLCLLKHSVTELGFPLIFSEEEYHFISDSCHFKIREYFSDKQLTRWAECSFLKVPWVSNPDQEMPVHAESS